MNLYYMDRLLFVGILFLLFVPVAANDSCRGRHLFTGANGTLSDGIGEYSSDAVCEFHIVAPSPGQIVTLQFDFIATECGWDYVTVCDGDSILTCTVLAALSGYTYRGSLLGPYVSSGQTLIVRFVSDGSVEGDGFTASYSTNNCLYGCSNHGTCAAGVCHCDTGFTGRGCELVACPNGCGTLSQGRCEGDVCVCHDGWTGASCTTVLPPATWGLVAAAASPEGRAGATLTADASGEHLFLFGGYTPLRPRGRLGDLWLFSIVNRTWMLLNVDETEATSDHTAVWGAGRLLFFGGQPNDLAFTARLAAYDPATGAWTNHTGDAGVPSARARHAAALVGDAWYVFGGVDALGWLSDLHVLNVTTMEWQLLLPHDERWQLGRLGATLLYDSGASQLLLLGGFSDAAWTDLWTYNLTGGTWTPTSAADGPLPYFHSAVMWGSVMYTWGGSQDCDSHPFAYDRACGTWMQPEPSNPPQRTGWAVAQVGPRVFAAGGFDGVVHDDLWEYTFDDCATNASIGCPYRSDACAPCFQFTSCRDCSKQAGCGWCVEDATRGRGYCTAGSEAGARADTCAVWQYETCSSVCDSAETCFDCGAMPGCGYDLATGACVAGASGGCPPFCGVQDDCESCVNSGCAWQNSSCVEIADVTSSSAILGTCPLNCISYASCTTCLLTDGCVWEINHERCFDEVTYHTLFPWGQGGSYISQSWVFCPAGCDKYTYCDDCTADPRCGWCASTGSCLAGNASMPSEGTCTAEYWDFLECPCAGKFDCESCTADARCAFCADTWECDRVIQEPSAHVLGQCSQVNFGECHDCSSHQSCGACAADPLCGWCENTNQCLLGNDQGVPPYCAENFWNTNASQCPNCSSALTCSDCGGDHCVWCSAQRQCVAGHNGVVYDPAFTGCQIATDCGCDPSWSCTQCTAHPRCNYCATVGRCYRDDSYCSDQSPLTLPSQCSANGGSCDAFDYTCRHCLEQPGCGFVLALGTCVSYIDAVDSNDQTTFSRCPDSYELSSGVQMRSKLYQGETNYYFIRIASTQSSLSVTQDDGAASTYMSYTTDEPSNATYSWSAVYGSIIFIGAPLPTTGVYWLAVTCEQRAACDVALVVTVTAVDPDSSPWWIFAVFGPLVGGLLIAMAILGVVRNCNAMRRLEEPLIINFLEDNEHENAERRIVPFVIVHLDDETKPLRGATATTATTAATHDHEEHSEGSEDDFAGPSTRRRGKARTHRAEEFLVEARRGPRRFVVFQEPSVDPAAPDRFERLHLAGPVEEANDDADSEDEEEHHSGGGDPTLTGSGNAVGDVVVADTQTPAVTDASPATTATATASATGTATASAAASPSNPRASLVDTSPSIPAATAPPPASNTAAPPAAGRSAASTPAPPASSPVATASRPAPPPPSTSVEGAARSPAALDASPQL